MDTTVETSGTDERLIALSREFDAMVVRMQRPAQRRALRRLEAASPTELRRVMQAVAADQPPAAP